MERSSIQKISKKTQALNDTLDLIDLIDIYRAFHLKATEYKLFSIRHQTFSRIDCLLGYKASQGKFKKNRNHTKHLFQSHHYVIRNQVLGEKTANKTKQNKTKTPTHGF